MSVAMEGDLVLNDAHSRVAAREGLGGYQRILHPAIVALLNSQIDVLPTIIHHAPRSGQLLARRRH